MSGIQTCLAIDLGAESGRAMLGILTEERLELQEVHRFTNGPNREGARIYWNALYLWNEIKKGIAAGSAKARALTGKPLGSIGVDTWGVDFGLIDTAGELIGQPVHYRDARTTGILARAFAVVPRDRIFARTGIQFLQFNTLFQLFAMRRAGSPLLDAADRLLMMPDLFNFWLTGIKSHEYTIATTSQCYNPIERDWAWDLLDEFKIPKKIFGEVTPPATLLGPLRGPVVDETGAGDASVVLPATHDTGSAVIAVPAAGENWAYISSGTWALVGAETSAPVINEKSLEYNFTNEGGAFGTNRLLCNVMGLWLLQQARRCWSRPGDEVSYDDIVASARNAQPFSAWIDPDDESFFNPDNMVEAIVAFCRKTNQSAPDGMGNVARCIIESLAMKYRYKIECIERMQGKPVDVIHVVGGGSRNELLCQATADACGRRVVAGPSEATAMGNVLVQAAALGALKNLDAVRAVARASSTIQEYEPRASHEWEEHYQKFLAHAST